MFVKVSEDINSWNSNFHFTIKAHILKFSSCLNGSLLKYTSTQKKKIYSEDNSKDYTATKTVTDTG